MVVNMEEDVGGGRGGSGGGGGVVESDAKVCDDDGLNGKIM